MYAIIKTGGKQYRVAEGQTLKIEKLDVESGSNVDFDQVLMIANGENSQVGQPLVAGAKVSAEVLEHGKGKKVSMVRFKRRKHSMKWRGHRQPFTTIKITKIAA